MVNISMLLTFQILFKDLLKFPFTYAQAKSFLIENMIVQHTIFVGNTDVAKFWEVVQTLFGMELISGGKDFALEDGYIYLCLMKVYPFYMKEMRQRGDAHVLSKPTLEHYLKLDKTVFTDYMRKRFADSSNNWCYKMKYDKLGIDLIKVKRYDHASMEQHQYEVDKKYSEMGINLNGHEAPKTLEEEELPFPPFKHH